MLALAGAAVGRGPGVRLHAAACAVPAARGRRASVPGADRCRRRRPSNLLVPLYFVIAGATVAYVWRQLRAGAIAERRPHARPLELAIAAFLGAVRAPVALLARLRDRRSSRWCSSTFPSRCCSGRWRDVRWDRSLLVGCAGVLVVLALAFSAIGFWEYDHRELLWNPKVISANQFESYFRVNSVFWDPNVYGRFLAIVIVVAGGRDALERDAATTPSPAAALLAMLWGGLVLTFSQSSFVSLLAGLAVLAALRWDARRMIAVIAVAAALGAVFLLAFQDTLRIDLGSSSGLNKATSGRVDLIQGGAELFADRPLWGYGLGLVRARLPSGAQGQPAAGGLGLAHAAADGGGGAGPDRPRRLSGRCWRRRWRRCSGVRLGERRAAAARRGRGRRPGGERPERLRRGARGSGRRFRDDPRAHDDVRRLSRGPVHLGDSGRRSRDRAVRSPGRAGAARHAGARGAAGRRSVLSYLKRLASTGAAYTASSVISKLFAVALLPLYTRHLTRADYGAAEVLLAAVVALSIVVRLGIIEALLRFYYRFEDRREPRRRRAQLVRAAADREHGRAPRWRRPSRGRSRSSCSTGATRS